MRKTQRSETSPKYEIGVVYMSKAHRLWLAVSHRKLISIKNGVLTTAQPYTNYKVCRSLPVDVLCARWGISLKRLDELSSEFLPPTTTRTRPRGYRRTGRDAAAIGYELRFAKLLVR